MYEHKSRPLLPIRLFLRRLATSMLAAIVVVNLALVIGALGYRLTEQMRWLDAFLNAAMILTGMGPVDRLQTDEGKYFAIFYSLFSGFVVLTVGALILGPVLHRLLHALHLEDDEDETPTP